MSAGRGSQGQLNTDIAVVMEKSTWTERSPSTGRQLSLQYQCSLFEFTKSVQGHHPE